MCSQRRTQLPACSLRAASSIGAWGLNDGPKTVGVRACTVLSCQLFCHTKIQQLLGVLRWNFTLSRFHQSPVVRNFVNLQLLSGTGSRSPSEPASESSSESRGGSSSSSSVSSPSPSWFDGLFSTRRAVRGQQPQLRKPSARTPFQSEGPCEHGCGRHICHRYPRGSLFEEKLDKTRTGLWERGLAELHIAVHTALFLSRGVDTPRQPTSSAGSAVLPLLLWHHHLLDRP